MRYLRIVVLSLSTCALTFLLSFSLSGCGGTPIVSSNSPASPDPTGPAPTVVAVGEQVNGAAPNRKQEVQFSEAMDSSTITAQSFQVTDSSGKPVPGIVAYDSDFDIASFLPNPALQTSASYTATIATAVASAGGVHLANPYSYTFATRTYSDTSPISVNSVDPAASATCVSATSAITITFDEAPDASTVNSTNIVVTGPNGAVIPVTMSINVTTTQVVLTPNSPLPSGTITVTVNNVGDLADQLMTAPYTWSFSTACTPGGGGGGSGAEYLYFSAGTSAGTPEFYAYAIDAATGNLTPVPGMPFQASTGATPTPCGEGCGLVPLADPLGRFLFYNFTQTPDQRGVGSMKVNPATGALANDSVLLTPLSSNPVIDNISADPQGRFIYGSGGQNNPSPSGSDWLTSIVVGSDGTLSFTPGEPFEFPEGNNGGNIAAPAATSKFVFVGDPSLILESASQPTDLFTFTLDQSSGALTATSTTQDGLSNGGQVVTPSGKFVYAEFNSIASNGLTGPAELGGYQVNADGSLTPISQAPIATPQQPAVITMSPNGNFLYVSGVIYPSTPGGPSTNDIRVYAIDQNTGSLSLTAEYTNIPDVILTIDPAAKYLYIPNVMGSTGTATLAGYSVDPSTGALTPLPGTQTVVPTTAFDMAIVRPQ